MSTTLRPEAILSCGPLRVNLDRRNAAVDGVPVRLAPGEFGILAALVRHKGRPIPAGQLYEAAHGPATGPTTATIRVQVHHLRRKLRDAGAPELIGTMLGAGYVARGQQ